MRRHFTVLCSLSTLLLACGVPEYTAESIESAVSNAPFLPGEQQPDVDLNASTLALYPSGYGQNLLQTFEPQSDQYLGYVELPVGCAANVLLNVKIRNRREGKLIYDANVVGLPQVVDGTFQLLQVFNPNVTPDGLRLRAGRVYGIELAAFPGPGQDPASATCGIARGPAGDTYANGKGFYRDTTVVDADWVLLPDGRRRNQTDLPFRTLVR